MILLRSFRLLAVAALCLAALPAASALSARRAAPVISSVGPKDVSVGDTLTIRGRNFLAGAKRNTVVFTRDHGPAVSVKAGRATRKKIEVVVPDSLAITRSTRFGVRVRARGSSALKRKVLIAPAASVLDDDACALQELQDALDSADSTVVVGEVPDDVVTPDACADDGGDDSADDDPADDGTGDTTDPAPGA
jgi:IPT/TIG domain-containing protein